MFQNAFSSRHYAGDVVYCIKGFLEKNKDTLFQDFKRLMYSSSDPVISNMWPEGAQDITMVSARLWLCMFLKSWIYFFFFSSHIVTLTLETERVIEIK